MEKKTGKLENVKKVGILRDLEIMVNGQKFYERIKCEEIPKNIKYLVGRKILVEYEETTTMLTDWIEDRILLACFKIPRHYNQIRAIKLV